MLNILWTQLGGPIWSHQCKEKFHLDRWQLLHLYSDIESSEAKTSWFELCNLDERGLILGNLKSVVDWLIDLLIYLRYVHDGEYVGGFKQEELNMVFDTMQSNFRAWVTGFCPMAVGADLHSIAVQEFTRTFFNMRPDIALSISKTSFSCDFRELLPLVSTIFPVVLEPNQWLFLDLIYYHLSY